MKLKMFVNVDVNEIAHYDMAMLAAHHYLWFGITCRFGLQYNKDPQDGGE